MLEISTINFNFTITRTFSKISKSELWYNSDNSREVRLIEISLNWTNWVI